VRELWLEQQTELARALGLKQRTEPAQASSGFGPAAA